MPPLHSEAWNRVKWHDAAYNVFRAEVSMLKLVRNSWTNVVRADFDLTVEHWRRDLKRWLVL